MTNFQVVFAGVSVSKKKNFFHRLQLGRSKISATKFNDREVEKGRRQRQYRLVRQKPDRRFEQKRRSRLLPGVNVIKRH